MYTNHFLNNEEEYRKHFNNTYLAHPVISFDHDEVVFYEHDFDHAFFESVNRRMGDKSQFAIRRAWRVNWIRITLLDNTCELKQGWNKDEKKYDSTRKVFINCEGYIVIIRHTSGNRWRFVTAFQPSAETLEKIKKGPNWQ